MEQSLRNDDFCFKDTNVKVLKKTTENVMLTKKCNQCRYASSNSGHLALTQMLSTTLRYEVLSPKPYGDGRGGFESYIFEGI